jgi:hypothetical protein
MKREHDAIGLLVLWYRCEQAGALRILGFPAECPSTQGYKASRQYDDSNGAAEIDERGSMAKAVGNIVNSLQEPYRTALYFVARNRATGAEVWRSPRLPADKDERAHVVSEALALFLERV